MSSLEAQRRESSQTKWAGAESSQLCRLVDMTSEVVLQVVDLHRP